MTKRVLLWGTTIVAVIPLTATALYSQTVSPLHQVMASSSLINRPKIFRDMQASIKKDLGDVKPGLRAGILFNRMSQVRMEISKMVETPPLVRLAKNDTLVFVEKLLVHFLAVLCGWMV